MRSRFVTAGIWMAVLGAPTVCCAQQVTRIEVASGVGVHASPDGFGPTAPNGFWYLDIARTRPSLAIDAAVSVAWPSPALGVRIVGLVALPAAANGTMKCYPGVECPLALMAPARAHLQLSAGAIDLVYTVNSSRLVQPEVALGGGFKYRRMSWTQNPPLASGSHSESDPSIHAGVGVTIRVLGVGARATLSDYWNPAEPGLVSSVAAARSPDRPGKHDVVFTLGLRLLAM